jgi:hypothetical protein
LHHYEKYIPSAKAWAKALPKGMAAQTMATAFWLVKDDGMTNEMLQVLEAMGAITLAIDHYLKGKHGGLTLGQIARTRTSIEKELLLLPSAKELNFDIVNSSQKFTLYECCRLTAMIFGISVVFPIPNSVDIMQVYITNLKVTIEES